MSVCKREWLKNLYDKWIIIMNELNFNFKNFIQIHFDIK